MIDRPYRARLKDGRRWVCGALLCRGWLPRVAGSEGESLVIDIQSWHLVDGVWTWGSGRRRRYTSRQLQMDGQVVRMLVGARIAPLPALARCHGRPQGHLNRLEAGPEDVAAFLKHVPPGL